MGIPEGDPDEREIDPDEREWDEVDPLLRDLENPPPEPVTKLMERLRRSGQMKRKPVRRKKPKETKGAEAEEQVEETRKRLSEQPPESEKEDEPENLFDSIVAELTELQEQSDPTYFRKFLMAEVEKYPRAILGAIKKHPQFIKDPETLEMVSQALREKGYKLPKPEENKD